VGNIVAWSDRLVDTSIRILWDPPETVKPEQYELPGDLVYPTQHFRVTYSPVQSAVPRGWWRSVEHSFNGFAIESFIDELAHAANQDPYLFRQRLLLSAPAVASKPGSDAQPFDPKRLLTVLDLAAQKSNWSKPLGPRRGRGIACTAYYAYLAQVADVTVKENQIHVDRIVTVVDCGQVVNPSGARSQLEGGTLFSLGACLKEGITIRNGAVEQQNFNGYDLLRMPDAPVLETYLIDSHADPHGLGEAAVSLPAASVANAVFAATGKRLRRMPFNIEMTSL
jgi:isoquinoline 1-oxidoreductase beta subunit